MLSKPCFFLALLQVTTWGTYGFPISDYYKASAPSLVELPPVATCGQNGHALEYTVATEMKVKMDQHIPLSAVSDSKSPALVSSSEASYETPPTRPPTKLFNSIIPGLVASSLRPYLESSSNAALKSVVLDLVVEKNNSPTSFFGTTSSASKSAATAATTASTLRPFYEDVVTKKDSLASPVLTSPSLKSKTVFHTQESTSVLSPTTTTKKDVIIDSFSSDTVTASTTSHTLSTATAAVTTGKPTSHPFKYKNSPTIATTFVTELATIKSTTYKVGSTTSPHAHPTSESQIFVNTLPPKTVSSEFNSDTALSTVGPEAPQGGYGY